MLISVKELVDAWSIHPSGVIHIGAHAGEESLQYQQYNWKPVIWIEANPSLIDKLKMSVPQEDVVICAALWDTDDVQMEFNVASNGESSSLLKPEKHLEEYSDIEFTHTIKLHTKRLDSLLTQVPNFLNLDVQGAELRVMHGLGELIHSLDYVYTEVNEEELYIGCAKIEEIDAFLSINGFKRICLRRAGRSGWGDALYVRNGLNKKPSFKISTRTLSYFLKNRIYTFIVFFLHLCRFRPFRFNDKSSMKTDAP
jgi:FkbM family methyltransferase